jgi:hypothetical protein
MIISIFILTYVFVIGSLLVLFNYRFPWIAGIVIAPIATIIINLICYALIGITFGNGNLNDAHWWGITKTLLVISAIFAPANIIASYYGSKIPRNA